MDIRALAPAKINLGLEILGKREDGYHDVDMIMQTIDLYDAITLKEGEEEGITLKCIPSVGCAEKDNIAYKAAQAFFEYTKISKFKINIFIEKRIPICAGLAGGSSDAAAVIVGLNEFYKTNLRTQELLKIGESLGKDVPFCILGGTMRAQGAGSDLSNVRQLSSCNIVVVKPDFKVSTKEAYENVGKQDYLGGERIENLVSGLNKGTLQNVGKALFNRFSEVLDDGETMKIRDKLIDLGAYGACMSGSGPSVFGIFDKYGNVMEALNNLKKDYNYSFVCSPIYHGVKTI